MKMIRKLTVLLMVLVMYILSYYLSLSLIKLYCKFAKTQINGRCQVFGCW